MKYDFCLQLNVMKFTYQLTTESTAVDDKLLGANPSAEDDAGATADPSCQSGCNIVLANRLVETSYSKKDFRVYFKVSARNY